MVMLIGGDVTSLVLNVKYSCQMVVRWMDGLVCFGWMWSSSDQVYLRLELVLMDEEINARRRLC
jgi:hypothetical protein